MRNTVRYTLENITVDERAAVYSIIDFLTIIADTLKLISWITSRRIVKIIDFIRPPFRVGFKRIKIVIAYRPITLI